MVVCVALFLSSEENRESCGFVSALAVAAVLVVVAAHAAVAVPMATDHHYFRSNEKEFH